MPLLEAVSVFKLPEVAQGPATQMHKDAADDDGGVAHFPDNKAAANA